MPEKWTQDLVQHRIKSVEKLALTHASHEQVERIEEDVRGNAAGIMELSKGLSSVGTGCLSGKDKALVYTAIVGTLGHIAVTIIGAFT